MIYLSEVLNLTPARPITLDSFIELAQELLVPICNRLGARIVVAWFSNIEWFSQVTQVFEFNDMDALKEFRRKSSQDKEWGEYMARLESFAPERRSQLLEPLGPVAPEVLHKAIEESQKKPLKVYSIAQLEVAPNKMDDFKAGLKQSLNLFPIIASWRPLAGRPNEVIDIWKGDIGPRKYAPALDSMKEFFRIVRENAPKERLIRIFPLPYSQLK